MNGNIKYTNNRFIIRIPRLVVALVLLAIVGVSLMVFFKFSPKKLLQQVHSPTQTTAKYYPAVTIAVTPRTDEDLYKNYITYTNPSYGYSFSYPKNGKVEEVKNVSAGVLSEENFYFESTVPLVTFSLKKGTTTELEKAVKAEATSKHLTSTSKIINSNGINGTQILSEDPKASSSADTSTITYLFPAGNNTLEITASASHKDIATTLLTKLKTK